MLSTHMQDEVHVAEANARHAARRATAQLMVLVQAAMDGEGQGIGIQS